MKAATLNVLAMLSAVPMVGIAARPAEGNSDHQQRLVKLKITSPLRPGPAGRLNADGTVPPNYANYYESKATAGSPVPRLLVMNDGRKITTLTMWEERTNLCWAASTKIMFSGTGILTSRIIPTTLWERTGHR